MGLIIGTGALGVVLPPDAAEGDCFDPGLLFVCGGAGEYLVRFGVGDDCWVGVLCCVGVDCREGVRAVCRGGVPLVVLCPSLLRE